MKPATLLRAAEILEREADAIANGHQRPHDSTWDDDGVRQQHDEMIDIASKLRAGVA